MNESRRGRTGGRESYDSSRPPPCPPFSARGPTEGSPVAQQSGPGETRLRATIRRSASSLPPWKRGPARTKAPEPYDDDWGWWINDRLTRIETQIKWLITLAAGALAAEVIRLGLAALGITP